MYRCETLSRLVGMVAIVRESRNLDTTDRLLVTDRHSRLRGVRVSQPYWTEPPFSATPPAQNPPAPLLQQPAPPYDQTYQTPYGQATAYGQWYPPASFIPAQPHSRNTLLFVASILLLIIGSIGIAFDFILIIVVMLYPQGGHNPSIITMTGLCLLTTILYMTSSILGIKHASNPAKSGILVGLGISQLICGLAASSQLFLLISSNLIWFPIILIIPVLFLVAALMLNRQRQPDYR